MKEDASLKVIGIILAVAMLFTIITSNAVSVTSVSLLKSRGGAIVASNGTVVAGTTSPAGSSGGSNTPAAATTSAAGASGSATTSAAKATTSASGSSGSAATTLSSGGSDETQGSSQDPASPDTPVAPDYAQILATYTEVMDKAKASKPAYSKKEYQAIPETERTINEGGFLVSRLLGLAGLFMTEEDKAEVENREAGSNMKWFPVNEHSTKGCLLTDTSHIKSASQETLADGNVKIVITLNDDMDPEPYRPGEGESPNDTGSIERGFCGQMFSPLSRKDIDNVLINDSRVSAVVKDAVYSLNYHDCTATLVYTPDTKEIGTLEQHMVVLIDASARLGVKISLQQELHNYMSTWDFVY